MRVFFRHLWLPLYRLWALRHVQRERYFNCAGLRLRVPVGVFHPGVFFSGPIFISFLQNIDFKGKTTLDIGTGTGILALFAAQKGAIATALDINPLAVETAKSNAEVNNLNLSVLQSDLFDALPPQAFDCIMINPPYFARTALNLRERAFFAGENLEYFEKLFAQLPKFLSSDSRVWMILSEDCDFPKIQQIAAAQSLPLRVIFEKKKWGERFFVAETSLHQNARQ